MVAALGLGRALGSLVHMVPPPESRAVPLLGAQSSLSETRYATRQPDDTSGTFHGTPWLWGEPFSPTWPGPVRDGPVPQETCASADPAGPAAGGPKSEPQVR